MLSLRKSDEAVPATKINRFARVMACCSAGLAATALLTLIIADHLSLRLAQEAAFQAGSSLDGCNKRTIARLLFWGLLGIELITIGRFLFFPFGTADIEAYRTRGKTAFAAYESRGRKLPSERRIVLAAAIAMLFSFYGTYEMAYGGMELCAKYGRHGEPTLYWWMFGVFGLRAFVPVCIVDLWISASPKGGHAGPARSKNRDDQ